MDVRTDFRDASIEAYRDLVRTGVLSERRRQVLEMVLVHPNYTAMELAKVYRLPDPNVIRPSLVWLHQNDLIVSAGKRPCMVTGKRVYSWKVKPRPGQLELWELETAHQMVRKS